MKRSYVSFKQVESARIGCGSFFRSFAISADRRRRNFFGISALDEAQAFLANPILGPRLCACTKIVLESNAPSLHAVFGSPDDLKFRSSMTLFAVAAGEANSIFNQALQRYGDGAGDDRTLALLQLSLP